MNKNDDALNAPGTMVGLGGHDRTRPLQIQRILGMPPYIDPTRRNMKKSFVVKICFLAIIWSQPPGPTLVLHKKIILNYLLIRIHNSK